MRRLQDFSVDNSKYSLTACSAADPGGFEFSNELRMKYTRLDGERSRAPPLVENQNVCTKAITLARCPAVPSRSDNDERGLRPAGSELAYLPAARLGAAGLTLEPECAAVGDIAGEEIVAGHAVLGRGSFSIAFPLAPLKVSVRALALMGRRAERCIRGTHFGRH